MRNLEVNVVAIESHSGFDWQLTDSWSSPAELPCTAMYREIGHFCATVRNDAGNKVRGQYELISGACGYLYNCPPFEAAPDDCPPSEKNSGVPRSVSGPSVGEWPECPVSGSVGEMPHFHWPTEGSPTEFARWVQVRWNPLLLTQSDGLLVSGNRGNGYSTAVLCLLQCYFHSYHTSEDLRNKDIFENLSNDNLELFFMEISIEIWSFHPPKISPQSHSVWILSTLLLFSP